MTSLNPGDCTAATCPVAGGFLSSPPSLEGSAVMLAASAVLVPVQVVLGVRYRTPLYAVTFVLGLLCEVMGYVGRIMLRTDQASRQYFAVSLVGLVMGPTFISGAIYLVLPHVLVLYGRELSLVSRPLYLGFLFLAFNVFTLAFQAVGCSFAANGASKGEITQGVHVLIAGLGIQLGSLILFFVLYYWFILRITRERHLIEPRHSVVFLSTHFKIFGLCLQIATALLLIRTICRIVQFAGGLDSLLAQSEVMTVVLDGALVLIASLVLSLAHPGAAFGRRAWAETSPEYSSSSIRDDDGYYYHGGGDVNAAADGSVPLHASSPRYCGTYDQHPAAPAPASSHEMKKKKERKSWRHSNKQYGEQRQAEEEDYPPHYKPNIGATLSRSVSASASARTTPRSAPPLAPTYQYSQKTPPYEIPPSQTVPYVLPGEMSPRSEGTRSNRSSNQTAAAGGSRGGAAAVGLPARPKPLQLQPQHQQYHQQTNNVVDPDSLW